MITEAPGFVWDQQLLAPYFETVLETFGTDRLLFGSDKQAAI
jgi:predicted TIM-barrel fold metal-dependent hydrolase